MVLNGVSKAYAMTGWRIGYCGGPAHIITAMENIQSQSTSNPASISQAAAEAALNGDQSCITPMVAAFKERNHFVTDALNAIPGVGCLLSEGAFYAFADVRDAISRLQDQRDSSTNQRYRIQRIPAGTWRCRGGSWIGLWQRRLHPPFLRHRHDQSGKCLSRIAKALANSLPNGAVIGAAWRQLRLCFRQMHEFGVFLQRALAIVRSEVLWRPR